MRINTYSILISEYISSTNEQLPSVKVVAACSRFCLFYYAHFSNKKIPDYLAMQQLGSNEGVLSTAVNSHNVTSYREIKMCGERNSDRPTIIFIDAVH
jgi:hypothetical protein